MSVGRWRFVFFGFLALFMLALTSCGGGGGDETTTSATDETTSATDETTVTATRSEASLVALVDPDETKARAITRADSDNETVQGMATLVVDLSNDGTFGNADDKPYTAVIKDGRVSFVGVEVRDDGVTKAKLTVEKDGRAPYEKIVELSKDASLNLKVETTAIYKQTFDVSDQVELARRGVPSYIVLSLKKDASGTRRLVVRSTDRRDVRADDDTELQAVIPAGLLPEGTETLTASMRRFSGATDRKYFPGEFKGQGAPEDLVSERRDGENTFQLISVAFSFIALEDQNGNEIKLQSDKRAGEDTVTVTMWVPDDALELITEDADTTREGVQVPIYRYTTWNGEWKYIGIGDLYDSSGLVSKIPAEGLSGTGYYVEFEVPADQWSEYLNIDYPVWFGGEPVPKTVCIRTAPEAISGVYVWAEGNTWVYDYTADDGIARLEISVPKEKDLDWIKENYTFYWQYWAFDYLSNEIDNTLLTTDNLPTGCDYIADVTISDPYTATIQVLVKDENGEPLAGEWVYVSSYDDYYYWDSKQTDDNGTATFKVKPETNYTIWFGNQSKTVNVDGTSGTTDSGKVVEFQKQNSPPEVSVYVYPDEIKQGATSTAYISAYDYDGDELTLESATLGSENVTCDSIYSWAGYAYWQCTLSPTDSGNFTFTASISDGTNSTDGSASITVLAADANRPPELYGFYVRDDSWNYYSYDDLSQNATYTFEIYAWDPDGDSLTYTVSGLDNVTCSDNICQWTAPECTDSNGCSYNVTVTVTDSENATDSETYTLTVWGNRAPEIYAVSTDDPYNLSANDTIKVYAYAWDPDGNLTSDNFKWKIGENDIPADKATYENGFYSAEIKIPENISGDTADVCLTVDDDQGASSTECFTIWLTESNATPLIDQPIEGSETITVNEEKTFSVSAWDPDGDTLTYTWTLCDSDNQCQEIGNSQTLTYTFTEPGEYTLTCEVSDGKTTVSAGEMVITVVNPGDIGQAEAALNTFLNEPTDENYQNFISIVDTLGDSAQAHILKAFGALAKAYNDNKEFLNDIGIDSLDSLGEMTESDVNTLMANLLKLENYEDSLDNSLDNLITSLDEAASEIDAAKNALGDDEVALNIADEPVKFDKYDLDIMKIIAQFGKAMAYLAQAIELDNVTNWQVTIDNQTQDIRDLIANNTSIPDSVWEEFWDNNPALFTWDDTTKLNAFKTAVEDLKDLADTLATAYENMSEEELAAREDNAFDFAGTIWQARLRGVADFLDSLVTAFSDSSASLVAFEEDWTTWGAKQIGDDWYMVDTYDFFKLTLNPVADQITIYDLISGNKSLRDLIDYLDNDGAFYSDKLKESVSGDFYEIDEKLDTYTIPEANISISDNSTSDWTNVETALDNDILTAKVARSGNNFYLYLSFKQPITDWGYLSIGGSAERNDIGKYYNVWLGVDFDANDVHPYGSYSIYTYDWYGDEWQSIDGNCTSIMDSSGSLVGIECEFYDALDKLTYPEVKNYYYFSYGNWYEDSYYYSYDYDFKFLPVAESSIDWEISSSEE